MNPNKTDVTAKFGQIGTWQGDATLTSLNVRRPSVANPACIYTGLDCATSRPPRHWRLKVRESLKTATTGVCSCAYLPGRDSGSSCMTVMVCISLFSKGSVHRRPAAAPPVFFAGAAGDGDRSDRSCG